MLFICAFRSDLGGGVRAQARLALSVCTDASTAARRGSPFRPSRRDHRMESLHAANHYIDFDSNYVQMCATAGDVDDSRSFPLRLLLFVWIMLYLQVCPSHSGRRPARPPLPVTTRPPHRMQIIFHSPNENENVCARFPSPTADGRVHVAVAALYAPIKSINSARNCNLSRTESRFFHRKITARAAYGSSCDSHVTDSIRNSTPFCHLRIGERARPRMPLGKVIRFRHSAQKNIIFAIRISFSWQRFHRQSDSTNKSGINDYSAPF